MLNTIWAFMIIAGVVWAALHGNIGAVTQGLLDSATPPPIWGFTP